ncbi:geranylgeranylglyceryl/heptaprenylglyceryl phosphate synthase [Halobacteriaceae archaeon SHR40]|uniref:geranylgeranylglyceryl/heptaprenylglyceryl phosphate synthase n=1 Tax=Halovenus amylolytica TaxID=2500550 RepID=UPI000FE2DE9C
MSLTSLAKRFESLAATASVGGRMLLGLDTNPVPADWTHITKIDPEGEKKLPLLFPVYLSHTSAISVGGSQDVTEQNTEETFELLSDSGTPAFHEPSEATHVTETTREQADFLAVPEVLNGDSNALVGTLGRGLEYVRTDLGPSMLEDKLGLSIGGFFDDRAGDFAAGMMMQEAVFEAYIIMNLDSAAAREASVTEDNLLSPQEAKERALAAQHHLESEIIYLEYSGTFGGEEAEKILEQIDEGVSWSRIWYGGGLDDRKNVNRVLDAGADAAVVGDVFHRVAAVEAELFEQARGELDAETDREEIEAWVTDAVDVADTDAGRYLSTIPDVTQPEERAREYLAESLAFALAVEAIADGLEDPTTADIEAAVSEASLPGRATIANVSGADAGLVDRVAEGLLSARFDVGSDGQTTARHLAVEL